MAGMMMPHPKSAEQMLRQCNYGHCFFLGNLWLGFFSAVAQTDRFRQLVLYSARVWSPTDRTLFQIQGFFEDEVLYWASEIKTFTRAFFQMQPVAHCRQKGGELVHLEF
ncbi:hypothetical protein ATANTOWER_014567 [Ataeniobius toweri]|uniref:Uncharacterized protein n=1 Tax=Ataeniobius toweri TaxID=208326 RepID=A0ABU7AQ48_9TELE|nr:hypothetical protein [Ataeniobius toweri]